jgi:hypothetical protein
MQLLSVRRGLGRHDDASGYHAGREEGLSGNSLHPAIVDEAAELSSGARDGQLP